MYWPQAYYSVFISGLKETLTSVSQQIGYTANYKRTGKINEVTVLSQTSPLPVLYAQTTQNFQLLPWFSTEVRGRTTYPPYGCLSLWSWETWCTRIFPGDNKAFYSSIFCFNFQHTLTSWGTKWHQLYLHWMGSCCKTSSNDFWKTPFNARNFSTWVKSVSKQIVF